MYHFRQIFFVKTLEIFCSVVSRYHTTKCHDGVGGLLDLWSSFLRAQYWQTLPSIPTQLIISNVSEVFALLNIVNFQNI